MPYPRAHWYVLLLFPAVALAFWHGYFAVWREAPAAFHVHGVTASLWILLVAAQSWTIHNSAGKSRAGHNRARGLHRALGYGSFALFPLFIAGGLLVIQTMALAFAGRANPFYTIYGARLGAMDAWSSLCIPLLYYLGLKHRRKVHLHARYMLATIAFLLMPIFTRILGGIGPLAIRGPQDFGNFAWGLRVTMAATLALIVYLARRDPRHAAPWHLLLAMLAAEWALFETLGRTGAWESAFIAIGSAPTPLLVGLGLSVGGAASLLGWSAGRPASRAAGAPA